MMIKRRAFPCIAALAIALGPFASAAPPGAPLPPPPTAIGPPKAPPSPPPRVVRLSSGGGIGFDDLGFSPVLRKILVPAGGTGRIDLIDPDSLAVTPLVVGAAGSYKGGHGEGITSVDSDGARLFAIDRASRRVLVVDPTTGRVLGAAALSGHPDYVRWVEPTRELWVSEPDEERIEIFALGSHDAPTAAAALRVEGGPESLLIDPTGGRAFTHLWDGVTLAIDLRHRSVVGRWPNGCRGSRGIAFDERAGIVLAACAEGKLVALDANHQGRRLGFVDTGRGVDVIGYAPQRRRAYVPAAESADLTVVDVSPEGHLARRSVVPAAKGGHCATADDRGHAWVCDPARGQLLIFTDDPR
jgi:DNA-binding beta-propeller fold protein YncE